MVVVVDDKEKICEVGALPQVASLGKCSLMEMELPVGKNVGIH